MIDGLCKLGIMRFIMMTQRSMAMHRPSFLGTACLPSSLTIFARVFSSLSVSLSEPSSNCLPPISIVRFESEDLLTESWLNDYSEAESSREWTLLYLLPAELLHVYCDG